MVAVMALLPKVAKAGEDGGSLDAHGAYLLGLPVGTPLTAAHFVPGQEVDVAGITRGHGFQGGMKRCVRCR